MTEITQKNFTRITFDLFVIFIKKLLQHLKNIFSVCRCIAEGTILDNGQLICLYLLARLLQRELEKCLRLVAFLPMQDMDKHFGLEERIKV